MRPEFQDIVDEVSRLLDAPAVLEERTFVLIAFCAHDREIDAVRRQTILTRHSTAEVRERFERYGIRTAEGPVRIPADPRHRMLARLCLPVRRQGVTYGYLWLLDDGREIAADRLPRAMALASRAGALMATELRTREDLGYRLRDLISVSAEVREEAAVEISDLGHIPRGTPVVAAVLRFHRPGRAAERPSDRGGAGRGGHKRSRAAARGAVAAGASTADGLSGTGGPSGAGSRTLTGAALPAAPAFAAGADRAVHDAEDQDVLAANLWRLPSNVLAHLGVDHTVLLIPLEDVDDIAPARALVHRAWELDSGGGRARRSRPLLAGLGSPRPDLGQARGSWQEARLATRIGESLPSLGPVLEWGRLGVYRLLARIPEGELRDSTLDPAVRRLFDRADPELIRTVEVYLDEAGNAQRSAGELAVHRQTLYYRLRRVEEISGLSLSSGDDRLVLHVGLKMGHLFGLVPGPPASTG